MDFRWFCANSITFAKAKGSMQMMIRSESKCTEVSEAVHCFYMHLAGSGNLTDKHGSADAIALSCCMYLFSV